MKMEYEFGKWLERLEAKLDMILIKLYPEETKKGKEE